ncbi:hypothetical protein Pla52o_41340 [Novipirellula galeiformis]|uniref:Glycosyltransferase RgtA/B/C/D-like domain-containing protein n=1 Tax=Novipirellula galeiformis TaxID=2528004 RepID=A0A5C6CCB7_9BACT|nr:hypothetical protein [Novipirellula galeiformis]TWU21101.1 hypothetical protein Pla52o_41340 [Novipirellula galeiformis]
MHKDTQERKKRRTAYLLLILIGLSIAAGRIATVTSREGDTAFLSANDRSRWCTVAALVEDGTYEIDRQIAIKGLKNRTPWNTIDKVRHRGSDGKLHYYSSKPPLFPTLVAGVYFVVHSVLHLSMSEHPIYATRIVLMLVNLPLLALFYVCTIGTIERVCGNAWARQSLALAIVFGTMLLPFSMTLNNHLVAAAFTALTLWIYLSACEKLDDAITGSSTVVPYGWYFLAGLAAAFTAANELPALSMLVLWFVLFVWIDLRALIPFLAGIVVIAIGFFGTNVVAHGSLRPPYAHRGNGDLITEIDASLDALPHEQIQRALVERTLIQPTQTIVVKPSDEAGRWSVRSDDDQLFSLTQTTAGLWALHFWDDWYEYPNSYWQEGRRRGVDRGEPSRLVYFLNMTVGHHGIFSITPIFLLLPWGLVQGLSRGPHDFRRFTLAVLIASVTCLLFYLARPMIDRNYGGVSCCFRWVVWFTPLWLVLLAPTLDQLAETARGRGIFHAMIALSVFSVSTALNTPWQSPWIYQFWSFLGWLGN